jgi:putative peptide zinc metalloprotease protein
MSTSLFSEAWHRVARQRARLKPEAEIQRHSFRGTVWYVLRNPLTNQFARVTSCAYYFVCRLRLDRTIEHVWRECLEIFPEEAPTQQEVIQLLAQLANLNLLTSDLPPDVTMTFERHEKTRQRELRGKWLNFLYLRLHVVDPTPLLDALLPVFRPFFSRTGFWFWAVVVFLGIKVAIDHSDTLAGRANGFFAPSNIFLIYVAAILTKAWHELGHALLCRFFGGEVRTLGVMLLLLTPLPYVDVSTSWSFPRRNERMLVAAGGMIFEFFLAALAIFVWASTPEGPLNSTAYNVVVLASITTLLFNLNPLLRFDGYYILGDWLQIPNLSQRALLHLKYLVERHVFRLRQALSPAQSAGEGHWLWIYAVTSGLYRLFLVWTIFFVLAEHFLGLGLVLACFIITIWVVLPAGKFIRYLATDPFLRTCRPRAITLSLGSFATLALLLALVPMPHHFFATGIVEADVSRQIYNQSDGYLAEIVTPPGSYVHAGEVLLRLHDPLMPWKLKRDDAQVAEAEGLLNSLTDDSRVAALSARTQVDAARAGREELRHEAQNAEVLAPIDGVWVAPQLSEEFGNWMPRGTILGEVIQPGRFRFLAVVQQDASADLFSGRLRSAVVRLRGQSGEAIRATDLRIIPAQQHVLPSAALGWPAGGEIETDPKDTSGLQAKNPFFIVSAELAPTEQVYLAQRRSGEIRFAAAWEPLLTQALRHVRQLFQERVR